MIFLFLAQARFADVEPSFFVGWLVSLCLLLMIVLLIAAVWEKFKAKKPSNVMLSPNPLRTHEVEHLATRAEVQAMGSRLEHDIDELRVVMGEDRKQTLGDIGRVHSRIDLVAKNTSEIMGQLQEISGMTHRLIERAMNHNGNPPVK